MEVNVADWTAQLSLKCSMLLLWRFWARSLQYTSPCFPSWSCFSSCPSANQLGFKVSLLAFKLPSSFVCLPNCVPNHMQRESVQTNPLMLTAQWWNIHAHLWHVKCRCFFTVVPELLKYFSAHLFFLFLFLTAESLLCSCPYCAYMAYEWLLCNFQQVKTKLVLNVVLRYINAYNFSLKPRGFLKPSEYNISTLRRDLVVSGMTIQRIIPTLKFVCPKVMKNVNFFKV